MEALAVRPAEAAKALGLSRSLVYELLESGQIESIRVGAARLIPVESLRGFIDKQRAAAQP